METSDLNIDAAFWTETEKNTALLNSRLPDVDRLQNELERAANEARLRGHVVFATSGSTGNPKFACLSRSALLASAHAVNQHMKVTDGDHWFCALPSFHVGGVGIWARAHLLNCKVTAMRGRWDPVGFCEQISKSSATLTAVVPTQVHDLVHKQFRCPDSLRTAFVGGGALVPEMRDRATGLGWPLAETFGMTETASQVATQRPARADQLEPELTVLPIWSVRNSACGVLEIKGEALFSGYLVRQARGNAFEFVQPFSPDGWFRTSDQVELLSTPGGMRLRPLARTDDMVKILGENVSVSAVEAAIHDGYTAEVVIAAIPDRRTGNQLIAVVDRAAKHLDRIEKLLQRYNLIAPAPERVFRLEMIPIIPRSEVGKVAKHQLISLLSTQNNFRILK